MPIFAFAMDRKTCISVILPLRLAWTPSYWAEEGSVVRGSRVRVRFANKVYSGVVEALAVEPSADPSKIADILAVEDLPPVSEAELRLWQFIAEYYLCSIGEVFRCASPAGAIAQQQTAVRVRERMEKQLEGIRDKMTRARRDDTRQRYAAAAAILEARLSGAPVPQEALPEIHLSDLQSKALGQIRKAFLEEKIVLLNGVTGSGKTELYAQLARETLAQGRNVLYLVPEIALSRQLEDRLEAFFGDTLQVFHSALTAARRQEVADTVRKHPYIVLGTRSALFLPHRDLGLVIVDEEHDTSYKQDSAPRYQGRDTAVVLGRIHGSRIILGSATPSLESLYNCETGRYALVSLSEKYHGGPEAEVEIIDTRAERRKNGMTGSFSRKLAARISQTLSEGGQAVILRSRRAYAPVVQCTACGMIPKCPNCNVSLSYHKTTGRLVCHHCGHQEAYTGTCPSCGQPLEPLGAGTQRIEEELHALFPEARIARLDSDAAQDKLHEQQVIRDFAERRTDILVGTQIVTKGFDFEGLSLVAVLQADSLLGQQDFRADERALQLLEQFRGRCARRGSPGRFVIQTAQADHPVYRQLAGQSPSPDFIGDLLAERRAFGYPPYSRIILLICRDTDPLRLDRLCRQLTDALCAAFVIQPSLLASPAQGSIQLTGPYAPPLDRTAGQFIRHIRLTLRKDASLSANKQLLAKTLAQFEKDARYPGHIFADVDPV
ncbi:MAG: primosomal protein N' [Bacteroidales bacterium]|nr:primosomal protein N' [Bacteroidales bacterium]